MKIKVEVQNKILGDSVFWEGEASHINQIRNIVAENLAQQVRRDGVQRKSGMWVVSAIIDEDEKQSMVDNAIQKTKSIVDI